MTELIDHFTPMHTKTIKFKKLRREPWLTAGLVKSINKDKRLYRQTLRPNHTINDVTKYKNYHQILGKVKRHCKRQYYIDQCDKYKNNTKQLWQTINRVIGHTHDKTTVIDRLKVDNIIKYDPKSIANELGNYFSTVGKTFAKNIEKPENSITHYLKKIKRNEKSLFMTPTTTTEISKLIDNIPNKTSCGHNSITNVLLKKLKDVIVGPLTDIFNALLCLGEFPTIMKLAEVIPFYKGKSRELGSNYRPISLLITLSKILEKLIYNRVYGFLTETDQIYQSQYGFRKRHSCKHAIGKLTGEIVKNLENKKLTATIFLDLSKAFDTLEHSTLLAKLENLRN